jgi:hypothetical protein
VSVLGSQVFGQALMDSCDLEGSAPAACAAGLFFYWFHYFLPVRLAGAVKPGGKKEESPTELINYDVVCKAPYGLLRVC